MKEILSIKNLDVYIEAIHVIRNISLQISEGESIALFGRNGAGKTTTIKSVLGLRKPKNGSILFKEKNIVGLPTHKIIKLGIGYAPEDRKIYPFLTVKENLALGLRNIPDESQRKETLKTILEVFPHLKTILDRKGVYLSGGEQKMLAVARAMAIGPSLLLLDEPLEGLSPSVVVKLSNGLTRLREMGISMLIAESSVSSILRLKELVDRAYVIERGEIIFKGGIDEILSNDEILKVLGVI